jgi:hypothetical protein
MYAKLVTSTAITPAAAMRDIVRLLTSSSPNVANLEGFSQTSSVIVDSTPAGWTYVVGTECYLANSAPIQIRFTSANVGGPPIGASVNTANVIEQHTISAPCLDPLSGVLKYAVLTSHNNCASTAFGTTTGSPVYYLTACSNANTSTGVLTNESYRTYYNSVSGGNISGSGPDILTTITGQTVHLISTARHVTLVHNQRGVRAVWETSQSEADVFYNAAPLLTYGYSNTVTAGSASYAGNSGPTSTSAGATFNAQVINFTRPSTGVNIGVLGVSAQNPFLYIHQQGATIGANTVRDTGLSSTGLTRHFVTPIFFHSMDIGIPIKFITGVVPIYMMKGGTGSTGDTVTINGVDHLYIDSHASPAITGIQPLGFASYTYS